MYVTNVDIKVDIHHVTVQSPSVPEFSLPVTVQRYCRDMKTGYLQQSVLPESDWPPSLGGQYIRLALISQGRSTAHHMYKDVIEQQIDYTRGDYDKILEYKTKIELEAAFGPFVCEGGSEIKRPLKMLIDGAPGVGKTTLSRKVSYMWAKGELLEKYWLVLLLHLRESTISKAKTVDDFFYNIDSDLQCDVVKYVKERSGNGVLIIFDGFDELSSYERSMESLFLDVSSGKILPMCAVVITSRPYASRSLQEHPAINRHIEILGFTEEQVTACIRQKIIDKVKAEELCEELKDRLDVASICQIPLNCSIVLYVYEQERYSLPRTLTELYDLFILHSLKRFIKRTKNAAAANRLLHLNDLPCLTKENLVSLCGLAYKGLEDDKLVFSRNDMEKVFPLASQESSMDLPILDLMTSAKSYGSRGAQDTYSFLHLTIQEFLAAYWIAYCMSETDKQFELFQNNFMDNRFRMVLLFLSGMSKLTFLEDSSKFSQISWTTDTVHACHLLYESANYSLCKSIANECFLCKKIKITGSRFDVLVTSHFIAYSDNKWDTLELRPKDMKIVRRVFDTCAADNVSVLHTVVERFEISRSSGDINNLMLLKILDEFTHINKITVNILIDDHETTSFKENLSNVLMGPDAIHKKEYAISFDHTMHFTHIDFLCEILAECLAQNGSLTGIVLKSVSALAINIIFTRLSQGNSVSKLAHLTCIKARRHCPHSRQQPPICQKFCSALATFLSRSTSIIQLELDIPLYGSIVSDYMETIKSGLANNTVLQKLSLCNGHIIFKRNELTKEMELVKALKPLSQALDYDNESLGTCQHSDPSPSQAKRFCQDNRGGNNFSASSNRDSPIKLNTDVVHSNQISQPQFQSSMCLSVSSSPHTPAPNHSYGAQHDIHVIDLTTESPPPQVTNSPDVIDLTQDSPSPQPNDHTHSHSTVIKQESFSGHVSHIPKVTHPRGELMNMQNSVAPSLMGDPQSLNIGQRQCSSVSSFSYSPRYPSDLVPQTIQSPRTPYQSSTMPPRSSSFPVNRLCSSYLAHNSPSLQPPRNYWDHTHSLSHSLLPSAKPHTQLQSSPLVKQETHSGHDSVGQSSTVYIDHAMTLHMQSSAASPLMGRTQRSEVHQQWCPQVSLFSYPPTHPSNMVPHQPSTVPPLLPMFHPMPTSLEQQHQGPGNHYLFAHHQNQQQLSTFISHSGNLSSLYTLQSLPNHPSTPQSSSEN